MHPTGIGPRLKAVRRARGYQHQKDLYNAIGISSGTYSRYEKDQLSPPLYVIYTLAKTLDCPIEYLLDGETARMDVALARDLGLIRDNH